LTTVTLPLFDDNPSGGPRRVSLIRLSGEIARSISTVGRVAVEGEVYRPRTSKGGGVFFTLRDRAAQIEVKLGHVAARRSRVVPGERVCVVGGLQWANDRGQVHLAADEVTPVGAGAIAELIAETRKVLAADGLISRTRRPIPRLPSAVGVVCGSDAAVRQDIESVAAARCPGLRLFFEETTVSGPAAFLSIIDALEAVVSRPGVEVVILARGGGDAPSLLPWSAEELCRAVAACRVPVVSAIGHEADRPLCDEVADLRCGTPSLAATAVLPDLAALAVAVEGMFSHCGQLAGSIVEAARRRLQVVDARRALSEGVERSSTRLDRVGLRLSTLHPASRLAGCEARLSASATQSRRLTWEKLGRATGHLEAELRHLKALSPNRTLERGYAIVTDCEGSVVRASVSVEEGDPIAIRLASGRLSAAVTGRFDTSSEAT
jgi:exodeoxyribonuclease VII large subunit